MLRKNEEREGVVENIGANGEGVLKADNTVVFIPFVLQGERIKYKILKVTSKCAYGKAIEILETSKKRITPICTVYGKCGGCRLQHIEYNQQLSIKRHNIEVCFKKITGINVTTQNVIVGKSEFRYRNKLQLPVGENNGNIEIGFYAENSHRIIPITDCPINAIWTKDIIKTFQEFLTKTGLKGYDENNHYGDIREIAVKEINGNLIITIVSTKKNIPQTKLLIDLFKKSLKREFSLYLNYKTNNNNFIYGDEFYLLYGTEEYSSEMLGIKYKIGVQSFMQVNTSVCEKLYETIADIVGADNSTVIDAYSGAGLLTAIIAKKAKKVIGIEIVKEAVDIANTTAISNGLKDKITNYCAKCEDILPNIVKEEQKKGAKITVVLDPPRKGCDYRVIESLIENEIDTIIYISCMPSTLARDIGLLVGSLVLEGNQIKKIDNVNLRYRIEKVIPFDMFPQTKHVETVVLLSQRNGEGKYNKTINELPLTKTESKPSYETIKDYVMAKYNISLSTLDIANAKDLFYIKERENYNVSKNPNYKKPSLTEEKKIVLKEAFEHFKMI